MPAVNFILRTLRKKIVTSEKSDTVSIQPTSSLNQQLRVYGTASWYNGLAKFAEYGVQYEARNENSSKSNFLF